jgi:hypothetical protein
MIKTVKEGEKICMPINGRSYSFTMAKAPSNGVLVTLNEHGLFISEQQLREILEEIEK